MVNDRWHVGCSLLLADVFPVPWCGQLKNQVEFAIGSVDGVNMEINWTIFCLQSCDSVLNFEVAISEYHLLIGF